MAEVTDDTGETVQTEEFYYDLTIGEFIFFERDGGQLKEMSVFDGGEVESWSVDEFRQECLASEYRRIDDAIVADPKSVVEEVMWAVLNGEMDSLAGYESWEVRFAWNSLSCSQVDYAL